MGVALRLTLYPVGAPPAGAVHEMLAVPATVPTAACAPVGAAGRAYMMSVGQEMLVPVQTSAGSHWFESMDGRQVVPGGTMPSAGQLGSVPEQLSATSHAPAALRQREPTVMTASSGQFGSKPVQLSAISQSPAALRQTVVVGAYLSSGHSEWMPSQTSSTSHTSTARRHTTPALTGPLAPQQGPIG